MRRWCDLVISFLLAPACAACNRTLLHPTRGCVCGQCWDAIVRSPPPHCVRCGGHVAPRAAASVESPLCPVCASTSSTIEATRAIGPHEGTLREIIHALKYDGRRSIAPRLAASMRVAAADLIARSDAVVPVPLHRARRRARGFNQAADLARHLGRPVVHALARVRNTPTQTALPAAARLENVSDAFDVRREAATLRGRTVVLVDDVRTTGATLQSCARVLREAGVERVFAVTAARVETPGA